MKKKLFAPYLLALAVLACAVLLDFTPSLAAGAAAFLRRLLP